MKLYSKMTSGNLNGLTIGISLLLVIAVATCVGGSGGDATGFAADVLIPPGQEEQLGLKMSEKLSDELQFHQDQQLQTFVDTLGEDIVAESDASSEITFDFHLVKADDTVNAFAIPGGGIYVYSGLLKEMETEAELVSVLSHEVAHVTERHIAERMVAQFGLQTVSKLALGEKPGKLAQIATGVAGKGYLLKYSRDQESQADRTGLRLMELVDYDPNGMVEFFKVIKAMGGSGAPEFLSSHPLPENRISDAKQIISEMTNPPTFTGKENFQTMKGLL